MTALQDIRKTITDPTPFYAAVGLVDKTLGQVRTASDEVSQRALELRSQLKPELIVGRAQDVATERVELVQGLPQRLDDQRKSAFAQAEQSYSDLSERGAGVISHLRDQQEAQTEQFVKQGKATAASARKAAEDAQAFATKTVLAGRKEAAKQVGAVAGSVETTADKIGDTARTEVRSTAAREGRVSEPVKPAAKKAPAKKATTKKTAAKRPARKTVAKKAPAKKTATTKAANTKA